MKWIFLVLLFLGMTGCSLWPFRSSRSIPSEPAPELYVVAQKHIEAARWADAELTLNDYLAKNPTSRWQRSSEYLLGVVYEGQDKCPAALEKYRGVIQDVNSPAEVQAQSLFRSSFCWEAQGEEVKVIASLNDVWGRRAFLPIVTREAELPARLAAAYARAGNFDEADRFFKMAEEGLIKMRSQTGEREPDWLGRTLYTMGHLSSSSLDTNEFRNVIRPIPRSQAFLVRAAATNQKPYADLAHKDISGLYQKLLQIVELALEKAPQRGLVDGREQQRLQWDNASEIFELVRQLRSHLAIQSRRLDNLYSLADQVEVRVQKILASRPVGEGLTPEALSRVRDVKWKVIETTPLESEKQ